ncbi:MAG: helix-turn-helix domain-containing protein [Clostridium sp.]|nr:helix-turn-helix domain-containing protein [Clostridium sp.]
MDEFVSEMYETLELPRQSAQAIVDEVGAVVRQNINMMDCRGYVIASTDQSRIGSLHEGAKQVIERHLPELCVTEDTATDTSRPGVNLPVVLDGRIIGVIGITGPYKEVEAFGQVVKKMVEILVRENMEQDEQRLRNRVLSRFLEDWIMGDGLLQPRLLSERGFRLGIDIALPRRVMVAGVREMQSYGATPSGQKMLEGAEAETARLAGPQSLVLRSAGRQIILVRKCSDRQMEQLAGRIRTAVLKRFGIRMLIGIDGGAGDIHLAYSQANKAWRSAGMASRDILSYDRVTLELFTEDLSDSVKAEYIRKVFKKCSYEELCRWMGLLEAYFEAEGSLQEAAENLHIHKNTLTYKLKRLEEETGYDVRLMSQTAVFYMAMLFFRDVKEKLEGR